MKRMLRIITCPLLLIFILSGCSHKDVTRYVYNYEGENDQWSAIYSVECTVTFTEKRGKLDGECKSNNVLVVTYKGELEDLSYVKTLGIAYKSSLSGGKQVTNYDEGEVITSKTFKIESGNKGGPIPIEDDVIKVTIEVDGVTQTFDLANQE